MKFEANFTARTIFGTMDYAEQSAYANSAEEAERCLKNALRIFSGDSTGSLKLYFSDATAAVIYREFADIESETVRVRIYDAANSWREQIMSLAAMRKYCRARIRADFPESAAA